MTKLGVISVKDLDATFVGEEICFKHVEVTAQLHAPSWVIQLAASSKAEERRVCGGGEGCRNPTELRKPSTIDQEME